MPAGKYPTISAIDTTREVIVPGEPRALSKSDTITLKTLFPRSPIYFQADGKTAQSDAVYRNEVAPLLEGVEGVQRGDSTQFDSVNLDYDYSATSTAKVPDFPTDPAEFEGRYYPNLVVPADPAAGEDGTSSGVIREPKDNYGSGPNVTQILPVETAAEIANTTIAGETGGDVGLKGQSKAHKKNPGALTSP